MRTHRALFAIVCASVTTLVLAYAVPRPFSLLAGFVIVAFASAGAYALNRALGGASGGTEPRAPGSEFLGSVSHEIRTPLNGILGLTQLLLRMKPTAEQSEYLEMIKASGESLLRQINDILDYSRIRAGRLHMAMEEFHIEKLIRQTVTTHAPQAHLKGLELIYEVMPEVPRRLVGDPARLRQVLGNLLVNAIKFTDRGDVSVQIGVESLSAIAVRLRFSVTDTGIGIPEESRGSIFEAFNQVARRDRLEQGVGLGLTISKEVVEAMGGALIVASDEGAGSTFTFSVDLAIASAGMEADLRPACLQELKMLIVDDNEAHRRVLRRQMELWDVRVEDASDSASALAAVEGAEAAGEPFSLLLLDSKRPDVDPWSLSDALQEQSRIPGVLMTSSHEHLELSTLRDHGFVGQLTKPIAPSHLARAITIIRSGAAVERPEDVKTDGMDRLLLSGLSVLLAEDDPVNRKVAAEILENGGSTVVSVNDGRSALEKLATDSFDIALLDIQMPELDGLEVAHSVRRRESRTGGHIPLVAVTAHTREEDRERCLGAGMDAFLAKPFGEEELVSVMGYALRQSRAKRRAGSEGTLVDREAALARANGDALLLAELVDLFLEDAPEVRKELASSVAEGRFESVERLAHRVKGSLLTLSARDAARIALELEDAARSESAQRCHELLERLLEDLARLEAELADMALRSQA